MLLLHMKKNLVKKLVPPCKEDIDELEHIIAEYKENLDD